MYSPQDLDSIEFAMKKTRAYAAGTNAYESGKPRDPNPYTTSPSTKDQGDFILEDCFWNGWDIAEKKVKDKENKHSLILGYVDLSKFKKR